MIVLTLVLTLIFNTGSMQAQTGTAKLATTEAVTPANVLKWTKEVLPKMEKLVPVLEKLKANPSEPVRSDALKFLATVSHLKEINTKGAKLKAAEARRYYDLTAAVVNSFYIECKSQNGNVCCVDCHNHGILGIWCYANCFVARFPGD